jgi:hypothetical protein
MSRLSQRREFAAKATRGRLTISAETTSGGFLVQQLQKVVRG